MTIKELRKYRENLEKLACIERQLERRHTSETVQGSQDAPSYEKVNRTVNGYIHGAGTVSLLAEKSKLIHENERIEEFIEAIPDQRVYDALFNYCINKDLKNPKWNKISDMFDEDPDALRKYVERKLKKISECVRKCP